MRSLTFLPSNSSFSCTRTFLMMERRFDNPVYIWVISRTPLWIFIPLYDELFNESDHICCLSIRVLEVFPLSFLAVAMKDRTLTHPHICCADALYRVPCNVRRYVCRAIRYFPKAVSCPLENAGGSHSMWHRHAHVKVVKIRFPVWSQNILEGINVKTDAIHCG